MLSKAPPCYDDIDEETPLLGELPVKQVMGLRRSSLLLFLYLLFYVVYLGTGGLVFAVLEGPIEAELRDEVAEAQTAFLARNPCVSGIKIKLCFFTALKQNPLHKINI